MKYWLSIMSGEAVLQLHELHGDRIPEKGEIIVTSFREMREVIVNRVFTALIDRKPETIVEVSSVTQWNPNHEAVLKSYAEREREFKS